MSLTTGTIIHFLLLLSIVPSSDSFGLPVYFTYEPDILGLCRGTCETNLTFSNEGGSDLFCDKDCSVQQCHKGCSLYKTAVHSSCQKVCITSSAQNITTTDYQSQDEMRNCIQGCIFALDEYSISVKDQLGFLSAPVLDRPSLGHSSLTLKWETPILDNVTYKVHKRLVDMDSGWHLHPDTQFRLDHKIELTNLHPYVTYRFKVLALVSSLPEHILESLDTVDIMTLPFGVPSTAPQIRSLTTPSPRAISLSWTPPLFANGKLLSYRIYVEAVNHPLLNPTTVDVPWNATSWLLSQLQSSQKYVISLSAYNAEGEGQNTSRTITTPNPGNMSINEAPYLILGVANKIVKRNILDVIQYAGQLSDTVHSHPDPSVNIRGGKEIYVLKNGNVKDVSLHIRRQLILATDSAGQVTMISLKGDQARTNHYPSIMEPGAISVDWLADRVYVASRDRIYSCPLEKDLCVVVTQGLPRPASDVKVDPINGYLFYVIKGSGHGLYRINLGDISHLWDPHIPSSSSITSTRAELIVAMDDLQTHAIDFYNVHLYLVNNSVRTMTTAFLDGSNMRPFHNKTINSAFNGVTSMVFYNQTFIWTNKAKMYVEEYESPLRNYRHNELLFFTPPYTGLNILHPSAQPIPTPSTAPDRVEALFVRDRAVIRWKPPVLLQYQDQGAWGNWSYELQLAKADPSGALIEKPRDFTISEMNWTASDLDPDTLYAVQVRAISNSGSGPWSTSFIGRTLKEDGLSVLIGVAGEIVENDISTGAHKNVVNFLSNATDIDWHDDLIMWVTNTGSLSVYNRTSQQKRQLMTVQKAHCLAYDWLGHKVYWSAPTQMVIRRSDINGITSEFVRQTPARDIALDTVGGRLYWATSYSIETASLNGDEHHELFTLSFFTGPSTISLTLNFDMGKVMWYVKGPHTQTIYMANLVPPNHVGAVPKTWEKVGDVDNIANFSPIQYFSQRLFWQTEQNSLVVGDSQCKYTSAVSFYSNVTAFSVLHPSMHAYPRGLSKQAVRVIPDPIRSEDIQTVGDWSKFNLTWPKSVEVTHGTVFYKVNVEGGRDFKQHFTINTQWYEIAGLSPYTQLVVSIQPYTYWGYADPTTVSVRSPMSKPTAPLSPEVYVIQHKNATASHQSLAADFRWMTPLSSNGVISYHKVTHWMGDGDASDVTVVTVKGSARHFILTPLVKSQTYHFKVAACTEAGCGPESVTKTAVTDALNPIPTLLIASSRGLFLTEIDNEPDLTTPLLPNIIPEAVSFLAQEDPRMFWVERRNKLYENSGSPFSELVDLNGTGKDLTIDWISRTLYTVESVGPKQSNIMQFNIDRGGYTKFLSRRAEIGSIVTDPYNSAIMWTEKNSEGRGQILVADIRSKEVEVILGDDNSRSRRSSIQQPCSCSRAIDVSPVIAMNYKRQDGATEVVFVDKNSGAVYSSDINGCQCSLIFKPTAAQKNGLPPSLLTVDHMRVSWYDNAEGKLYSVSKATGKLKLQQSVPNVKDIMAYGSHLQPLPDSQCLDPGAYNSSIENIHVDSTYIRLRLAAPIRPAACKRISSPQDKFTIYYRKVEILKTGAAPEDCRVDSSVCFKQESYTVDVELNNLEPFTQYLIQVAVSNYYTEYLSEAMSEALILKTKFGVPQASRDVVTSPLTPEKISVRWLPPLRFNGPPEMISYVVQFSTLTSEGAIQRETENVIQSQTTEGWIQTILRDLKPDHAYNIKVQTCTANRTRCNGTDTVQTHTFKIPSNITFLKVSPHSVEFLWRSPPDNGIVRHQVVYSEVETGSPIQWQLEGDFPRFTENYTDHREEVTGLKPNTLYAFGIKATYRARPFDEALYTWPPDPTWFTHKTLVYRPDQPSPPTVTHLKSGSYEVRWEEPVDNGAPITHYLLEYKNIEKGTWKMAYNGSLERWLVETSKLEHGKSYFFRVAAMNSQGMGPFSTNSSRFLAAFAVENSLSDQVTIGIIVGIVLLVAFIIIAIVIVMRKRHEKTKTQHFIIRGPDTELATLRDLPHTTFQQSNTLYAINIQCTDEEIAKLPHFSRNQLVLTMFLGSGAFGEVFEGFAKNILGDNSGETKCAVKTLRKSASDHEKEEFLKEALLMKNFQHEHILSLLGVCLDNDPQFIIMELMEGGDLLSFLRSCRATTTTPAKLLLPDLVRICVHVARGCKYLEDMHFVHRDLAARNCLVSTKSPLDMIVKIGDFGLARDIYKNDYYRKEGEGLLPVRWMSPESLVDGFFTTQSDIWAFGVLMWEVVTLGQQPYPARTNIEVLHFVRDRGKLERPDKCADEIYALMSKCWSFLPDNRPSFASLLEHLEMFQEKCRHMSPEEIAQFSPSVMDAHSDVVESMSEEEEEEEEEETEEQAVTRGLFTPNNRTITGGGSVRLTQSAKQKRLNDLLGSHDTPEKLVVDLTKIGRKRTHSLEDSKHSPYSQTGAQYRDHFPAAGEYDHNGYLEPRGSKGGGRYLELMNYAPELRYLRDPQGNPLVSGSGSAFTPVHMTRKGYHPASVSYTLLSHEEDAEDAHCQNGAYSTNGGGSICAVEDPSYFLHSVRRDSGGRPYGLVSVEESPIYSQVRDDRRHYSSDSSGHQFGDYAYYPQSSRSPPGAAMMKSSPSRKYSDQDLYSSTAPYRQRRPSSSSSSQDHRYASVECNNNRNSTSNGNFNGGQVYSTCDSGVMNGSSRNESPRNRHGSGGNYYPYAKPGIGYPTVNGGVGVVEDDNSKMTSSRDTWASNLDDVFLDNDATSECSTQRGAEFINCQGQGHNSSRSRGQVYPESNTAVVGYEPAQVSLV